MEIPDSQWQYYEPVLDAARKRNLLFALGGGFAFSVYTKSWRNTKDIDLFILEQDREAFIEVLHSNGFSDYHDVLPYDRSWIYRGYQGEVIIDLIWQMANHRAKVDERWFKNGASVELRGETLRAIAVEELIWAKVYIVQRDRCDWPDVLNLLEHNAATLDWDHLLARMGDDAVLLASAMKVWGWLSPQRAQRVPSWVWERFCLSAPEWPRTDKQMAEHRRRLIDSRPWFRPAI